MQIPKKLPQFEKLPALFVTAGEYEANFYLAFAGRLKLRETIKMPPRTEAREKQAFVGRKGGLQSLAAVSHKGRYIEDLKKKFQKKFHSIVHVILTEHKLKEIYLFAPRHAAVRLMKGLSKAEQKNIRMEFFREDTKLNPLVMVKKFWETEQAAVRPGQPLKNSGKKILARPKIKKL